MPSTFPTAPDNIRTDIVNGTAEADTHPNLHNQLAESVNAVQASLLAGGSLAPGTNGFAVGSVGTPSIFFTGDTNTGIYHPAADQVAISTAGVQRLLVNETGRVDIPLLNPTVLAPAGNVIEQRNGTNAQTTLIYNTYTDASNYERLRVGFSANITYLTVELAGTGVARPLIVGTNGAADLQLRTNGVARWTVNASGGFLYANTDNAFDIGQSFGLRPRNIYQAGGTFQSYNPGAGIANDGTNYERLDVLWFSNTLSIQTNQGGTGVSRTLRLGTRGTGEIKIQANSADVWTVENTGRIIANFHNAYDIGTAANAPRNIYVGTSVVTPLLNLAHRTAPGAPANGDIWTTTTGMFVRINGVTKSVDLT